MYKILGLVSLFVISATMNAYSQSISRIDIRVDTILNPTTCPYEIRFTATIHSTGTGTLKYHWERSDGATDTRSSFLTLSGTGTDVVTTTWTIGRSFTGWEKLVVSSPVSISSPKGHFTLKCKGGKSIRAAGNQ